MIRSTLRIIVSNFVTEHVGITLFAFKWLSNEFTMRRKQAKLDSISEVYLLKTFRMHVST